MKMLIVAATRQELTGLYHHFRLAAENFVQTENFDVLITGVGMTSTAFALGKYLSPGYSLVLNVGIAGSFDSGLAPGDLVQVVEDTFAELGAEDHENFLPIDELGFGQSSFKATAIIENIQKVKAITINKVHGNADSISQILQLFPVKIESMEGAAVFFACTEEKIPCAQVRSISNYVEPRNKNNWEIGLAIKNLNGWLVEFLKKYEAGVSLTNFDS